MNLSSSEISSILKDQIEKFDLDVKTYIQPSKDLVPE